MRSTTRSGRTSRPGTGEALARFEAALVARGHPLISLMSPGLTDHEIAATMRPTGLRVDCAGPASGRVVYRKGDDHNTPEDLAHNTVSSLADVFDRWTTMLTNGEWDLVDGSWTRTGDRDPDRLWWL